MHFYLSIGRAYFKMQSGVEPREQKAEEPDLHKVESRVGFARNDEDASE